jgi:hypothetical protein
MPSVDEEDEWSREDYTATTDRLQMYEIEPPVQGLTIKDSLIDY